MESEKIYAFTMMGLALFLSGFLIYYSVKSR